MIIINPTHTPSRIASLFEKNIFLCDTINMANNSGTTYDTNALRGLLQVAKVINRKMKIENANFHQRFVK